MPINEDAKEDGASTIPTNSKTDYSSSIEDALITLTDLHDYKAHEATPDSTHFETDNGPSYQSRRCKGGRPTSSPTDTKPDEIEAANDVINVIEEGAKKKEAHSNLLRHKLMMVPPSNYTWERLLMML